MNLDKLNLKEILLNGAYVTTGDIRRAEDFAKSRHTTFIDYLLTEGLITRDLLGQAIAEHFAVPYADLSSNQPTAEQVLKIPESIAKKYRVVLFSRRSFGEALAEAWTVTTDDPSESGLLEELGVLYAQQFEHPPKLILAYSLPEDIDMALANYRKELATRFATIIKSQKHVAPEIIEEILEDAFIYRASDIHFEPQENEVVIRFRIDGVMHEAGKIIKEYYEGILNRVKVQAKLRIDEHHVAQDGAIRYPRKGGTIDLRVSIAPMLDGEKIEIRVLSEYIRSFTLADLGLSSEDQSLIEAAARKPFGMILVTGPTGSGKTTTLYALIKLLNRPEVNITTIEDPVEYKIIGVNQIQVNTATRLTFAEGLRSVVRQDPDIILVGEIRDKETAEIAVNAALTGHLLLSTFHANDAATGVPRLLDMGVEPFLLASTMEIILAQRLVRKICETCRFSQSLNLEDIQKVLPNAKQYFPRKKFTLYAGKGCANCGNTGYRGRMAVFEIIRMTPEMRELILHNPPTDKIWALARSQGSHSLFEDGIRKIENGITTLEELLRVASPPEDVKVAEEVKQKTRQNVKDNVHGRKSAKK